MFTMGQVNRISFSAVPDSRGTLTIDLSTIISQDQRLRGFHHKATYYVMQPCITTVRYICCTTAVSHSVEMSCLADVFALRVLY